MSNKRTLTTWTGESESGKEYLRYRNGQTPDSKKKVTRRSNGVGKSCSRQKKNFSGKPKTFGT